MKSCRSPRSRSPWISFAVQRLSSRLLFMPSDGRKCTKRVAEKFRWATRVTFPRELSQVAARVSLCRLVNCTTDSGGACHDMSWVVEYYM